MVRWTEFVKSVDAIFTLPGLEKRPLLDVAGSVEGLRADCAPVAAPMSASDAKLADAALVEIAREVREKRHDEKRANRGHGAAAAAPPAWSPASASLVPHTSSGARPV